MTPKRPPKPTTPATSVTGHMDPSTLRSDALADAVLEAPDPDAVRDDDAEPEWEEPVAAAEELDAEVEGVAAAAYS